MMKFHKLHTLCLVLFLFAAMMSSSIAAAQEATPEPTSPETSPAETTAEPTEVFVPATRPVAGAVYKQDDVTIELLFDNIRQGRVGLVHVYGEGVSGARLRFRDRLTEFFPVEGDGYYGLLVVNMDQAPRIYDFSVQVFLEDGTDMIIPAQVNVTLGGFIRQDFALVEDRAYLADPQVERAEFARLDSIFDDVTLERLWAGESFQPPATTEITSPFGAFRVLNDSVQTRHTGWDLRAPVGTPVMTIGAGTVAFAGELDIRGLYVVVDHGYGIYSSYAHLSQIHVTRGQVLTRGQLIGLSGNTGRGNGAHLHWEVVVNGEWVDSVDFLRMWLP